MLGHVENGRSVQWESKDVHTKRIAIAGRNGLALTHEEVPGTSLRLVLNRVRLAGFSAVIGVELDRLPCEVRLFRSGAGFCAGLGVREIQEALAVEWCWR
jgi:hypothetical protein